LAEFADLSLNLLCIAGTDGYFKYLNPAWETTFGYSRKELLSRPYIEFVHPDDREATVSEAEHVASGRSTLSFENRYRCKDGSYRCLLWAAIGREGNGFIDCVAADVTERRREGVRLAAQCAAPLDVRESTDRAARGPKIIQSMNEGHPEAAGAQWPK